MSLTQKKLVALVYLLFGAVAAGQEPVRQAGKPDLQEAAKPAETTVKPGPGRMFVTGRVLDPNGKPVFGASVVVHARILFAGPKPPPAGRSQIPLGDTRTDHAGRFRLDMPRTTAARHSNFGAIALAPGFGPGWLRLDADAADPSADITLLPEQVVHGRLFDVQGKPVPGVRLSVQSIRRAGRAERAQPLGGFAGVFYSLEKVVDIPAWPRPVTTDAEGRYTVRGLGRDLEASFSVHDPRFALQSITVQANEATESKPATAALIPAQTIIGRVTYADTGKGVPRARLEVRSSTGANVVRVSFFETDAEGRFRINPPVANRVYGITAFPPEGQPYLIAVNRLEWPKGVLERTLDLALPRGVLVHGKVTEHGTGNPVAGATVAFVPRGRRNGAGQDASIVIETEPDGSFGLGVKPAPRYLIIRSPNDDHVLQEIGSETIRSDGPCSLPPDITSAASSSG